MPAQKPRGTDFFPSKSLAWDSGKGAAKKFLFTESAKMAEGIKIKYNKYFLNFYLKRKEKMWAFRKKETSKKSAHAGEAAE